MSDIAERILANGQIVDDVRQTQWWMTRSTPPSWIEMQRPLSVEGVWGELRDHVVWSSGNLMPLDPHYGAAEPPERGVGTFMSDVDGLLVYVSRERNMEIYVAVMFEPRDRERALALLDGLGERHSIEVEDEGSTKISIILPSNGGGWDSVPHSIPAVSIPSLESSYGPEMVDVHETVSSALSDSARSGIVILEGEPGTGKTSYIKWLAHQHGGRRDFIYVNGRNAAGLDDPSFLRMMLGAREPVLIMEDAEHVVASGSGRSGGVSALLNMSDGILGGLLNCVVIVTYNTGREKVDEALLRRGRIIAHHSFGKLPEDRARRLAGEIGIDPSVIDGDCTLADVYNHAEKSHATRTGGRIGFGAPRKSANSGMVGVHDMRRNR